MGEPCLRQPQRLVEFPQSSSERTPNVAVVCRGPLPEQVVAALATRVGRALGRRQVTTEARLRLTGRDDDGLLAQVNLRVGDVSARVQLLTKDDDPRPFLGRLYRHVAELQRPRNMRPWPDNTRQRLVGSGGTRITRHKRIVLATGTPIRAVAVMDAMDYDVHMFVDAETGEDAVVYRAGPSGLRLARQVRMHPPLRQQNSLLLHPHPTPALSITAAAGRFRAFGLPFVFFTNPTTGRGRLLYPRYDGGLTLMTPVDEDS